MTSVCIWMSSDNWMKLVVEVMIVVDVELNAKADLMSELVEST